MKNKAEICFTEGKRTSGMTLSSFEVFHSDVDILVYQRAEEVSAYCNIELQQKENWVIVLQ